MDREPSAGILSRTRPASVDVRGFDGSCPGIGNRALVRLSLFTAADAMTAELPLANTGVVDMRSNLRDALALMVAANSDILGVVDEFGALKGPLTREAIFSI